MSNKSKWIKAIGVAATVIGVGDKPYYRLGE